MNASIIHYIELKSTTALKCILSYLDKYNKISDQTILAIFRTIENEVIKQFSLPNDRKHHNLIRSELLHYTLMGE